MTSVADSAAPPAPSPTPVVNRDDGAVGDAATTNYVLYPFADLATVAFSVDQGWIGVTDANVAAYEQQLNSDNSADNGSRRLARVIVVAVVYPGIVVGYGVVLGAAQRRSALKEVIKREVPSTWQNVLRIGWLRVAPVSTLELASAAAGAAGPADESKAADSEDTHVGAISRGCHALFATIASGSTPSALSPALSATSSSNCDFTSWTPLSWGGGAASELRPSDAARLCEAIDTANASMLLPRELWLRSHIIGRVSHQPRTSQQHQQQQALRPVAKREREGEDAPPLPSSELSPI